MTAEPIPFRTTRYRCPTCPRTASSKARMIVHISRCWTNPEARGCKTCRHFRAQGPEWPDWCGAGVSLAGQVGCHRCLGDPVPFEPGGICPAAASHDGDGLDIKPGPITGCALWETAERPTCLGRDMDCGRPMPCPDHGEEPS